MFAFHATGDGESNRAVTVLRPTYNTGMGGTRPKASRALQRFIATIFVAGAVVFAVSMVDVTRHPVDGIWLVLAGLTMVTAWATLRLPGGQATFSISDVFTMTGALLYGPAAATVMVMLEGLVISAGIVKDRSWAQKAAFNATAPTLAMWLAASLFFAVAGFPPMATAVPPLRDLVQIGRAHV